MLKILLFETNDPWDALGKGFTADPGTLSGPMAAIFQLVVAVGIFGSIIAMSIAILKIIGSSKPDTISQEKQEVAWKSVLVIIISSIIFWLSLYMGILNDFFGVG